MLGNSCTCPKTWGRLRLVALAALLPLRLLRQRHVIAPLCARGCTREGLAVSGGGGKDGEGGCGEQRGHDQGYMRLLWQS